MLVAIGNASAPVLGSSYHYMKIKLTRRWNQMLKAPKCLKLTAKGTYIPSGCPAVVATKTFTLRR